MALILFFFRGRIAPFLRYSEVFVKNRQIKPTPRLFAAPVEGHATGISPRFFIIFVVRNLESLDYPTWRRLHDLTFSHFSTVPADGQTDT